MIVKMQVAVKVSMLDNHIFLLFLSYFQCIILLGQLYQISKDKLT